MNQISLNSSMRSNLLSLQQTQALQDMTQLRLSTGLKVNSAIDNPSNYYTASSLSNRAKDLSSLLDAMSQGIQTIKTASETLTAATKFLDQAKAIAVKAYETPNDIFAIVKSEQEFVAAIQSQHKGTILIDGTINFSDNFQIQLHDGQNIVGKNSDAVLNFSVKNKDGYGILQLGNNSKVSNLTINNIQNEATGIYAIFAESKTNIILDNLNINTTLEGDPAKSNGASNIYLSSSKATISGTININNQGDGARIILARDTKINFADNTIINANLDALQTTRAFEMTRGSKLNINNSQINIRLKDGGKLAASVAYLFVANASTININNSKINAQFLDSLNTKLYLFRHNNNGLINIDSSVINLKNESKNTSLFSSVLTNSGFINIAGNNVFNIDNSSADFYITSPILGPSLTPTVNIKAGAIFNLKDSNPIKNGYWKTEKDNVVNTSLQTLNGNTDFKNINEPQPNIIIPDILSLVATKPKEIELDIVVYENSKRQYNTILDQYNQLINDAGYKGINLLLSQDLKVNFNEERSSKIDVKGVDASTEGLGLTSAKWQSKNNVQNSLDEISSAINQIRSQSSEFGNYYSVVNSRIDFTDNLINVLTEGSDKLTLADMNESSANMLALQTRQQLAINALSLANQASQSVLRLF